MDYSNREYYVVWIQDVTLSNAIPILLHKSRTITEQVAFQYSSLDQAYGILHELWKKPDPEIERPSFEQLVSIYTRIVEEDYKDTLEESLHEISAEARNGFGKLCSLNILFSSFIICPSIVKVRKDLCADILNIFGSSLKCNLTPEEINHSCLVIDQLYEEFSEIPKSKEHAIEVGRIIVFALTSIKSDQKAKSHISALSKAYNLSASERNELERILEYPNIDNVGFQSSNSNLSDILGINPHKPYKRQPNKVSLITDDFPKTEADWQRLRIEDSIKQKKISFEKLQKYVVSVSVILSILIGYAYIKYKDPVFYLLDGVDVVIFLMSLVFLTGIIAIVPLLILHRKYKSYR